MRMSRTIDSYLLRLACLIVIISFLGCAGRNYLLIDYQVPLASDQLKGQVVRLQIQDRRQSESILSDQAADEFPQFGGIYSLAWILPDQQRILAGEHRLNELLKTIFTKRLTDLGAALTDDPNAAVPVLTISLKQLMLDLQEHKWEADLNYDAALVLKGHPTARENVHGSAERVRVIGRKGADTVLSEILSDVVNRLDLVKLFKNAELIQ
jgi:hypothetical protein